MSALFFNTQLRYFVIEVSFSFCVQIIFLVIIKMEDLEVLEYMYSNVVIHVEMLYKLLTRKQVKDEVYDLIKFNIMEYKKFLSSIKRMILVRNRKREFKNNILHNIASSIEANIKEDNRLFLQNLKEGSKIWILDIEKVEKDYKIKSKTVINLLGRMKKYEQDNLKRVLNLVG